MNYDQLCRKICEIDTMYIGSYFINFLEFIHPGWKIKKKMTS